MAGRSLGEASVDESGVVVRRVEELVSAVDAFSRTALEIALMIEIASTVHPCVTNI